MWWKRVLGNRWALGAGTLFGAPGVLDDFASWQRMVGEMSPAWANLLMGGGAVLVSLSLLTLLERHWHFIRRNAEAVTIIAVGILVLGLLGGIGYGISLIDFSRPEKAWVHEDNVDPAPTLNDCRMRAYEAIGGKWQQKGSRSDYLTACMNRAGFRWTVVEEGGGE